MGERKVLNKYFPPDFDPADLPKGQRGPDNSMKVRMMLPMTVRCKTCGEFMYKGTKFNCKKEDVSGEKYLGMQIFRFYMRCRKCSAEITYITDPQNLDYKVEHGASRNFEQWKQEQTVEEALKAKRDAEDEDKVKKLENKTADAKREMDMLEVLDDMLHTKGQHTQVSTEDAIAALKNKAEADAKQAGVVTADLTEEDESVLRRMVEGGAFVRRLESDEEELEEKPQTGAAKRLAPATLVRKTKVIKVAKKQIASEGVGGKHVGAHADEDGVQGGPEQASASRVNAATKVAVVDGGVGLGLGYGESSSSEGNEDKDGT